MAILATPSAKSAIAMRAVKTELSQGRRAASVDSCRLEVGNRRGSTLRAVNFRSGMADGNMTEFRRRMIAGNSLQIQCFPKHDPPKPGALPNFRAIFQKFGSARQVPNCVGRA